jgi:hypothetical protein
LLCDILKPVGFHIEEIHGLCCAFFTAPFSFAKMSNQRANTVRPYIQTAYLRRL